MRVLATVVIVVLAVLSCGGTRIKVAPDVSADEADVVITQVKQLLKSKEYITGVRVMLAHNQKNPMRGGKHWPSGRILEVFTKSCMDCHDGRVFRFHQKEGKWVLIGEGMVHH